MLDAVGSYTVSGLSWRVWPAVAAEEGKPWSAQFLGQGVGDSGFGVFEFYSQRCQPGFGDVLCFLYGSEVLVHDDAVLSIPYDLWCPLAASCLTDAFLGVGVEPGVRGACLFTGGW
jgi:hypothetical protein